MRNRICKYPGCYRAVTDGAYCERHAELGEDRDRVARDARERQAREHREQVFADLKRDKAHNWYNTRAWRKVRASVIADRPYCERCGSTIDLEVHHLRKARTYDEFMDEANLMVLCVSCHKNITAAQMRLYK